MSVFDPHNHTVRPDLVDCDGAGCVQKFVPGDEKTLHFRANGRDYGYCKDCSHLAIIIAEGVLEDVWLGADEPREKVAHAHAIFKELRELI